MLAGSLQLDMLTLHEAYRTTELRPVDVIDYCLDRAVQRGDDGVWISLLEKDTAIGYALDAEERVSHQQDGFHSLPLYGLPFAIKDSIDLAGLPTTAGCPRFAYTPSQSATCVEVLISAGAIPLGKTNLDQFATGLVGVRSPYGMCKNAYDPDYIAGGSSSGSAIAVAAALVTFALATDAAGSGRVPAALNNIVGHKPSSGWISKKGVVPACRSIDCVSLLAPSCHDVYEVLRVVADYDPQDPYSHVVPHLEPIRAELQPFVFGTPQANQLEFFGDDDAHALFDKVVTKLAERGGEQLEIDFAPFLEAGQLLYEGPWIADRLGGVLDFVQKHQNAILPITLQILQRGHEYSALEAFDALHRLEELKRVVDQALDTISFLLTPTVAVAYTIEQVLNDPIKLNANLGYYTTFMNLLNLAGVAVPAGFRASGIPFGVTVLGKHGCDRELIEFARLIESG